MKKNLKIFILSSALLTLICGAAANSATNPTTPTAPTTKTLKCDFTLFRISATLANSVVDVPANITVTINGTQGISTYDANFPNGYVASTRIVYNVGGSHLITGKDEFNLIFELSRTNADKTTTVLATTDGESDRVQADYELAQRQAGDLRADFGVDNPEIDTEMTNGNAGNISINDAFQKGILKEGEVTGALGSCSVVN